MASRSTAPFVPGRSGRMEGPAGVVIRECTGQQSASLIARRAATGRAAQAALAAFGVALPDRPRAVSGRGATFIWAGPGQWLVETEAAQADVEALLGGAFAGLAAICEQSDSRVVLEVAGPRVREALAKGLPIDLDPACFETGDVALTAVAHVSVHLRQVSAAPAYRLAIPRSYLHSFWHWLSSSAAEFGCELLPPGPGRR